MSGEMPVATVMPRMIPGPKPMPVLNWRGNYLKFMRDPIAYLYHSYRQYGNLCGFIEEQDGKKVHLCAFGPEYNQFLLTDNTLFHVRTISMDAGGDSPLGRLGMGLPVMNGDQHKRMRRMVMPAFHRKQIETYHEDMVSITDQIISRWKVGETRNLHHDLQQLTLRIVVKSLFGLDHDLAEPMGHMLDQWLKLNISAGLVSLDLPSLPMRRLKNLSRDLETSILAMITEKRARKDQGSDVLSMLIEARDDDGSMMTDYEISGQLNLLFAAGGDTSANTLAWTLFLLSQHPDILRDLVDELDGTLGGNVPSLEQINALPLLDRVLKEALRVLTPVTYNTRESTQDFDIGPYHVSKGTVVLFSHFITHRMPEIYPEPARFIPDRWLTIDPGPYEYLPFGTGARMCIGYHFAMMQMKVILAILLQRYRLELVPNARIDRLEIATLAPRHGLPMIVHRQDRQFSRSPVQGNVLEMVELPDSSSRYRVWGS